MDKKVLLEIQRQKELMSISEQGLGSAIAGGLADVMKGAIGKEVLSSIFGDNDIPDLMKYDDEKSSPSSDEKVSAKGQALLENPIFKKKLSEINNIL